MSDDKAYDSFILKLERNRTRATTCMNRIRSSVRYSLLPEERRRLVELCSFYVLHLPLFKPGESFEVPIVVLEDDITQRFWCVKFNVLVTDSIFWKLLEFWYGINPLDRALIYDYLPIICRNAIRRFYHSSTAVFLN